MYPTEIRDQNLFTIDTSLQKTLRHLLGKAELKKWHTHLTSFGKWSGSENDAQAEYTDRHARPVLQAFDKNGDTVNQILHNPAWDKAVIDVYKQGIVGLNYQKDPAPFTVTFAMGYLLSQSDVSLHCPVTMTGAVAHVLNHFAPADVKKKYLQQLTRMDGNALSGGTWATELHGGSDIGATTTTATPTKGKEVKLNGLKWFTSNANGGLAIATARPEGNTDKGSKGLGAYLVPTHLDNGEPNPMLIRRLKDKLGTCGVPTGEIDLTDTWATEIAPPPIGFKLMMEALGFSRIHNALSATGIQRRAFLETMAFADNRQAFGHTITNYPMVQQEILKIRTPLEASLALSFEAAHAFDKAHTVDIQNTTDERRVWLRLTTAFAKYLTAEDAIRSASRAIEVIGGNGYVYDRITPRLLRDAQVLTVWEGPANIQALELLRLLNDKYKGFELFTRRIETILEKTPSLEKTCGMCLHTPLTTRLQECLQAGKFITQNPEEAQRHARRFLHLLAETFAAALLLEKAGISLESGESTFSLIARLFIEDKLMAQPLHGIHSNADWAEKHFKALVGNI